LAETQEKLHAIGVIAVGAVEQVVFEVEIVDLGMPGERRDAGRTLPTQAGHAVLGGQHRAWRQCQKNGRKAGR